MMERYSRQIVLSEIGRDGQEALRTSRVLVVGVGGLGCPAALYLASAGVGRIGLIDGDVVELGNLQRQVLFGEEDLGRRKPEAARARLKEMNSGVEVDVYPTHLRPENAVEIFRNYDVIVDGTDHFSSKFLINDAALVAGKPVVSAGVTGFEGWVGVFGWLSGPCFRCWRPKSFEAKILSCRESGVLAPVAGAFGCLQATEVLKILLSDRAGKKEWVPLSGRILAVDFSVVEVRELELAVREGCPCRGSRASIRLGEDAGFRCGNDPGLERNWPSPGEGFSILDVREQDEWTIDRGIADATQWPLSRMESDEAPLTLDTSDRWLIVCQRGIRSAHAVGILRRLFPQKDFVSLKGGLSCLVRR